MFIGWVAVATAACGAAERPGAAEREVLSAEAGPERFDTQPMKIDYPSWGDYVRETSAYTSIARLTAPHPRASSAARYGINLYSRGANASWVLDGDPASGYWLAIDVDLDGQLANDPIWKLRRAVNDWRVDVTTQASPTGGAAPRFVVAFDGATVRAYKEAVRTGTITVGGHDLKFAISCPHGDCGDSAWVRLGFDLDEDGAVDLASVGSYECYKLRDRTVVAFGRSYDFEIAPDGSRLTLRRSATKHAARPTLSQGTPAPVFDAADADSRFSLAAARGHVVLIDFFSLGCHWCAVDFPWLARVHEQYARAGLDIVTIAKDEPPAAAHDWPVIVEDEPEPVGALYRVDAYPTYFVIDRDGKIACSRCKHDAADRVLSQLFAAARE